MPVSDNISIIIILFHSGLLKTVVSLEENTVERYGLAILMIRLVASIRKYISVLVILLKSILFESELQVKRNYISHFRCPEYSQYHMLNVLQRYPLASLPLNVPL